jgi:hypothetical protein
MGSADVEISFELRWWRPDIDRKPGDVLRAIEQNYKVVSFEMTSEERH